VAPQHDAQTQAASQHRTQAQAKAAAAAKSLMRPTVQRASAASNLQLLPSRHAASCRQCANSRQTARLPSATWTLPLTTSLRSNRLAATLATAWPVWTTCGSLYNATQDFDSTTEHPITDSYAPCFCHERPWWTAYAPAIPSRRKRTMDIQQPEFRDQNTVQSTTLICDPRCMRTG